MTRFEKLKAKNLKLSNRYSDIARIDSTDLKNHPIILPKRRRNRRRLHRNLINRRRKYGRKSKLSQRFSKLRFRHRLRVRRDTTTNLGKPIRIVSKSNYNLYGSEGGMSPFGMVAKMLTKQVLAVKNKTELTNWKAAVQHVRFAAKQKKEFEDEQNKRAKDEEQDDIEKFAFRGLKHEGIDASS
uniref:Ribosomal protein L32 n=1 Tax=Panagrolaimus superbus TaxID=310955 RepID=A0A914Z3F0_9BILA